MIPKSNGAICWLEFELLANFPKLRHGVCLRQGGDSQNSYASLNVSPDVGDEAAKVAANITKIKNAFTVETLSLLRQCHGTQIQELGLTPYTRLEGDAMITDQLNLGTMIMHADCQAAIFYDPVHHAMANVHAGWRGNVQNIYQAVIDKMKSCYQSNPADLFVCISPSLGPQHSQFINYKTELPENFWPFQVKKEYFDLWAISRMQLEACGILSEHIQVAEMDTYSNAERFFSYRRDKQTGRNGTVAFLI